MDPTIITPVLLALPMPILWASALMLIAWWSRREGAAPAPMTGRLAGAGPLRTAALALGGAMALGGMGYSRLAGWGQGSLLALPTSDTWPLWAALAAMVLALCERAWEGVRGLTWIFRALLLVSILGAISMRLAAWTPDARAGWVAAHAALTLLAWWSLERCARRPGPGAPLLLWLLTSMTAVTLMTTGWLKGGAAGSWLAAGCGAALLIAVARPRAGVSVVGPGVTVAAVTLGALWFMGVHLGEIPLWMAMALAACAPVAAIVDLTPIARLPTWKHALVRAAIALIPGVVVLAVAIPRAIEAAGDYARAGGAPAAISG